MKKIKKYCRNLFPMSIRDWGIFCFVFFVTSVLCLILQDVSSSDFHVPMIFVLGVLIIALSTNGYFYGCFAAFLSVFAVNWAFTYPYFKMDFSIYGYPLTFMTMLAVGIATSMLTSRVKEQERIHREVDKVKMRANLLRAISHDLRTPLTSISGSISAVLEEDLDASEKTALLTDAKKEAEWLCRMVENLLSITRINGDDIQNIQKQDEVLEEVLSEVVINFKKKYPDIKVSVNVPDELIFVPMDAMLIEQLVLNLMDNAVRHGETTSMVQISAVIIGTQVSISVCDNGKGISENELNYLFDESVKMDSSADKTRGMGIGLLVCQTIVNVHGGSIKACNLQSGGACFTFTLDLGGEKNYY